MKYRKNLKILLILIIFALVLFFIKTNLSKSAKKAKQNVVNLEKIEIGMTKEKVKLIMGIPDNKQLSFFNNKDSIYFYKPPFGSSSGIYIQFEDSSKKVNLIIPHDK